MEYVCPIAATHLRHKCCQASDRINDSTTGSFIGWEAPPKPGTPCYDRNAKERQGEAGYYFGEEPYLSDERKTSLRHLVGLSGGTYFWIVVILNLVSPDMETMRPMTDLSPVAKTTPVQVPWTTKVDARARLRVSRAFCEVQ